MTLSIYNSQAKQYGIHVGTCMASMKYVKNKYKYLNEINFKKYYTSNIKL